MNMNEDTTPLPLTSEEGENMAADIEQDIDTPNADDSPVLTHRKPKNKKLSTISKKYDEGGKGYLDEEEVILRGYDTNNDGSLDVKEMKKIVRDLKDEQLSKKFFKWLAIFMLIGFLLSIGCNFALTYVSLALTRQLETQDGKLVDRDGNSIRTQIGKNIGATANPDFARRYLKLHARRKLSRITPGSTFDFHNEFRRLTEEEPVAVIDENAADIQQDFVDYQDGSVTVISVEVDGTTFTGTVASGATFTPASNSDTSCDVYGNIREGGKLEPLYEVHCCDTTPCVAYLDSSYVTRRLNRLPTRRLSDEHECLFLTINAVDLDQQTPGTVTEGNCADAGHDCFIDETFNESQCYKVCESSNDCDDSTFTCNKEAQNPPLWAGWGVCQQCPNGQDSECQSIESCTKGYCIYNCDLDPGCFSEECFSSMSTVVEKSKGVMLLKDVKFGDSILASAGKFQPFLFSPHSNPSKPTHFLQIYTDDAVPLEVTPGHMVFLYGKNLPIQARNIKAGDILVGIDNVPKAVVKVSSVTRTGFYNALTKDATLYVDGLLASSNSALNEEGDELIQFGPFLVHVHTLVRRLGAPLNNALCNNVNSFFCETQVDDGSGGTFNILIGAANTILTLPWMLHGLIFPMYAALAAAGLLGYYVVLASGMIAVLGGIQYLAFKLKKKVKAA